MKKNSPRLRSYWSLAGKGGHPLRWGGGGGGGCGEGEGKEVSGDSCTPHPLDQEPPPDVSDWSRRPSPAPLRKKRIVVHEPPTPTPTHPPPVWTRIIRRCPWQRGVLSWPPSVASWGPERKRLVPSWTTFSSTGDTQTSEENSSLVHHQGSWLPADCSFTFA